MAEHVPLADIKFDPRNANAGTVRGRGMIEKSIEEFGFVDAGVLDKNNVLIGGNKRTEVAGEVGLSENAIVIDHDGKSPIYVRLPDYDLNDPDDTRARRLAMFLNRSQEVSLQWDPEELARLQLEAAELLDGIFFREELDRITAKAFGLPAVEDEQLPTPAPLTTCPNCGHQWDATDAP